MAGFSGAPEVLVTSQIPDDEVLYLGNDQTLDAALEPDTGQTPDAVVLWLGSGMSRSLIVANLANRPSDYALAAQTNPTIALFSATAASSATNQYILWQHDQTDGIMRTGTGRILFQPGGSTSRVSFNAAYTATLFQASFNYTLAWDDPSAARTLTIPDPGGAATFMFINQAQTVSAAHTFSGAQTFTGAPTVNDDITLGIGTDDDTAFVNRSTALAANTALTGVLVGTPVTPVAIAANSLIVGNVTASGDVVIAVNKGGTSYMAFMADASTGDTLLGVPTGQSFDVYIAGTKEIDYAVNTLTFTKTTTIATSATLLTLNPSTDVVISDGKGLIIGDPTQISWGIGLHEVQVLGTGNVDSSVGIARFATTTSDGPGIALAYSANATIGSFTLVANGDHLGSHYFYGASNSGFVWAAQIGAYVDGTPGAGDMPGRLIFATTADGASSVTERWRITSVGVLTSVAGTPAAAATADGSILATGGIAFSDVANAWIDDATRGDGTVTHYIGNNTINVTAPSDERVKMNWQEALPVSELLASIPLGRFQFRPEYSDDRSVHLGLGAQTLLTIWPEMVDVSDPDHLTIRWHNMTPYLLKGWQEHEARFSTVEERLAAVEEAMDGVQNWELKGLVKKALEDAEFKSWLRHELVEA